MLFISMEIMHCLILSHGVSLPEPWINYEHYESMKKLQESLTDQTKKNKRKLKMAKDRTMYATCKLLEEDIRNSSLKGYTSDGICANIKNIVYSRWIFQSRKQEEKESIEHFVL